MSSYMIQNMRVNKNIDVLFLLETHRTSGDVTEWEMERGSPQFFGHVTNFSAGEEVLFFNISIVSTSGSEQGRILITQAKIPL